MGRMAQARPYRGVVAADRLAERRRRFLNAGLDLLGGGTSDLTVRGVCRHAGLAARYFYESFTDKGQFVTAVFDWVIADIAATTQAAVAAAPLQEQSRAGMANIVRTIADDPRVGRLLFSTQLSNEVLARKRIESTAFFAKLLDQHAGDALHLPENGQMRATTHFAVGGVAQTIGAWLAGEIDCTPEQLVDRLGSMLDGLADIDVHLS